MITLSAQQVRALRSQAHHKKSIVQIGSAGLTDAVLAEIDQALNHHELMKVKVAGIDRDERQSMANEICERLGAALVQQIGHVIVLYRPSQD